MELLIGSGSSRERRIKVDNRLTWNNLVTLDINADHKPDVVWDLMKRPLPFADSTFDEVHAYEVLEHLAQQGDWRSWFAEWSEWWRILKPGGAMCGTSPDWRSPWAWGDPGHTRVVTEESLIFLNQLEYEQIGKTPMTDYRFCYRADFEPIWVESDGSAISFAMRAVKPSRCTAPRRLAFQPVL